MSYDVYLMSAPKPAREACSHCGRGPEPADDGGEELFSRNHTSNTSYMWRETGTDLRALDGCVASVLAVSLESTLRQLHEDPQRFRAREPENGWGSLESTIAFLSAIRGACIAHPDAIVRVSA